MNIVVVEESIARADLEELAKESYFPMIKGVVDIAQGVAAFGGEYHIDANQKLIERGSEQNNIWGFNVYLDRSRDTWIEYISLINIRPTQGNTDMEVSDTQIRNRMEEIVNAKIT